VSLNSVFAGDPVWVSGSGSLRPRVYWSSGPSGWAVWVSETKSMLKYLIFCLKKGFFQTLELL